MGAKRKAGDSVAAAVNQPVKKYRVSPEQVNAQNSFRDDLFAKDTRTSYRNDYRASSPYPHGVVANLIKQELLRAVRKEIISNIHFTLKETDIYRIHQSGDLANLTSLDPASLAKLPSLVQLRDALYSPQFRAWVSDVTGAGKLSGRTTDMAVNIYTPGSYLLCHDDVIGSRRVSYILYLTDPDEPWQAEWGGGLRLYPTETRTDTSKETIKIPSAEWSKAIPPAAAQLSFFTVLPGESYHDVEEVYHGANEEHDRRRIRMAVSGWFHIPQQGEDGYQEGLEQELLQKSSLKQLMSAKDEFDEPPQTFRHYDEPRRVMNASATGTEQDPGDLSDEDEDVLTEQDLTFLLKYITPGYLVPDKLEELTESFADTSVLQLSSFLKSDDKGTGFADGLQGYISQLAHSATTWPLSRPPHKHRYAYQSSSSDTSNPISLLLNDLITSHAFKKWLALATGLRPSALTRQYAVARRFRRGHDYALANTYSGTEPQLEFTLNLTPSSLQHTSSLSTNGHQSYVDISETSPGGEEIYMAADDDDRSHVDLPSVGRQAAGSTKSHDPAVYKTDDEDDPILFVDAPSWNTLNVVLRDEGTMRFVKYVSRSAGMDRWDIKGEVELSAGAFAEDRTEDGEDEDGLDGDEESQSVDDEEVGSVSE